MLRSLCHQDLFKKKKEILLDWRSVRSSISQTLKTLGCEISSDLNLIHTGEKSRVLWPPKDVKKNWVRAGLPRKWARTSESMRERTQRERRQEIG